MMIYEHGGPNQVSTALYTAGIVSAALFIIDMHMYGVFKRLYVRCDSCGARYPGTEITSIKMPIIKRAPASINQGEVQPVKCFASNEPTYKYSSKVASAKRQLKSRDTQVIKCAKCALNFLQ